MASSRVQPSACIPVSTTSRQARIESAESMPIRSSSELYRPISSARRSVYRPHPSLYDGDQVLREDRVQVGELLGHGELEVVAGNALVERHRLELVGAPHRGIGGVEEELAALGALPASGASRTRGLPCGVGFAVHPAPAAACRTTPRRPRSPGRGHGSHRRRACRRRDSAARGRRAAGRRSPRDPSSRGAVPAICEVLGLEPGDLVEPDPVDLLGRQVEARERPQLRGRSPPHRRRGARARAGRPGRAAGSVCSTRVARSGREPAGDVGVEERPGGWRSTPRHRPRPARSGARCAAERTGRERGRKGVVEQLDLALDEVPDRHDAGGGVGTQPLAPALDELRERAQLGVVPGAVIGGHERVAREEHEHRGHQPLGGVDRGERARGSPAGRRSAAGAEGDRLDEVALGGRWWPGSRRPGRAMSRRIAASTRRCRRRCSRASARGR